MRLAGPANRSGLEEAQGGGGDQGDALDQGDDGEDGGEATHATPSLGSDSQRAVSRITGTAAPSSMTNSCLAGSVLPTRFTISPPYGVAALVICSASSGRPSRMARITSV